MARDWRIIGHVGQGMKAFAAAVDSDGKLYWGVDDLDAPNHYGFDEFQIRSEDPLAQGNTWDTFWEPVINVTEFQYDLNEFLAQGDTVALSARVQTEAARLIERVKEHVRQQG